MSVRSRIVSRGAILTLFTLCGALVPIDGVIRSGWFGFAFDNASVFDSTVLGALMAARVKGSNPSTGATRRGKLREDAVPVEGHCPQDLDLIRSLRRERAQDLLRVFP